MTPPANDLPPEAPKPVIRVEPPKPLSAKVEEDASIRLPKRFSPALRKKVKADQSRKRRWLKRVFYLVALLGLATLLAVMGTLIYFGRDLPPYQKLSEYNPSVTTRLYAANGKLMEEYAKQQRIFVPITAMPKILIDAFIAAEDQNFYKHPGVDFKSVARAMVQNLKHHFSGGPKSLVGASTITQQVAKNFLLTNERTYARKIKEAILAFRMTGTFSKDRILELYLNEIYLGAGAYGVAAASLNYFNKSIDELTLEEAALLAALPKAPSAYDPRTNYKRARERRDWVIHRMKAEGFITSSEEALATAGPIRLNSRSATEIAPSDFFAEEVRRKLEKQYGEKALYEEGLAVTTTLDPKLQRLAKNALRAGLVAYDRRHGFHGKLAHINVDKNWQPNDWVEGLSKVPTPAGMGAWQTAVVLSVESDKVVIGVADGNRGYITMKSLAWAEKQADGTMKKAINVLEAGDVVAVESLISEGDKTDTPYGLRQIPGVNGAIVVMDPHTGRVLAMVGGFAYDTSQFNRATQAKRQPGSSFKPFVYLAALENNFTPATLINDEPIEFETVKVNAAGKPETVIWAPQNYSGDFYGPTTLRAGLETSRNVMTVRLGLALGIEKIMEVAKRFGVNPNPERNMATVLGAAETTLLDITNGYAMLVNEGKRVTPSLIERIQDRNGRTIFRRDQRFCDTCQMTEIPNDAADLKPPVIPDNREQVTSPQTAYQIVSMLEGVVKRGTGVRAQAIGKPIAGKTGTTNNAVDAWFIGFSPDLLAGVFVGYDAPASLGDGETGSNIALPIFVKFMTEALSDKPAIPFRIPPGLKFVKVDAKTGFLPSAETPEKEIILEAFKPGTEPGASVLRSGNLPVYDTPRQPADRDWKDEIKVRDMPEMRGTGGIY